MTDLVERLKEKIITDAFVEGDITSGSLADRLIRERLDAADEITRLREENETLRRDVKTAIMGDSAELQDVKRENERLRKYEQLVQYIASDYWELSHDKIKWLYTEYKTKSRKLIEEDAMTDLMQSDSLT